MFGRYRGEQLADCRAAGAGGSLIVRERDGGDQDYPSSRFGVQVGAPARLSPMTPVAMT